MSNKPDGQELIATFFAALELRHLDHCEASLDELGALARQQPVYVPWRTYLEGILVNERDHDWAKGERIFSYLLQDNLDLPLYARVWLALGRTYEYQGRWDEAIHAYESSLSLFTQLGQPIDQAKVRKQQAHTLHCGFTQGDLPVLVLPEAIAHCQAALALLESGEDETVAWLKGSIWNALGFIYVSLGQWAEALACYQQDLAICQALDDRYGQGLTYGNLGEVYQKQGNWPEALAAYGQALTLIREAGNHYEEIEALANLSFLYQEMGQIETALDHYQQTIQLIEGLRAGVSAEDAQAGFFATVVDTYANAVLLYVAANHPEQAFNTVEQARSRAFLDSLAARSPELAAQMQQQERVESATITLTEVQAALPPDTLLLEYFTTGLIEAPEEQSSIQHAQRHRFPPARTLIFAVTRDQLQVLDANLLPNDLRPARLDSVVERHFLQPQIRRDLYNHLVAPVETLLQGKRRLYIVPHGPLHYIPFQALLAPDSDTLLRTDGPELIYAPSATFLWRYRRTEPSQAPATCLALGYNGEDAAQLHLAEAEAQSIAQLTKGRALVGAAPKKASLYQQAAHYRLLHLACHGEFDPDVPLASFLRLGPAETLTAQEVLESLHLQCDLVTLSACESGLSRVRRGDELIGFLRAFSYAGAPALVATLWHVNDRPTELLMEHFYQEIAAGVGFAEALKRAQLYVKHFSELSGQQLFADPYYWAAFILFGAYGS
ncbi:MAG: hypothetical protein DPW09_02060 [Anaerolineae bacterium]|nr:CHAT domain-containing protein [Anaerolineae bacterium]MCQ3972213.1 hypothetical protein [Anaerolineae bacterium]